MMSFTKYACRNMKMNLPDESQLIIAKIYAERFCSTKANNYFEGLNNEKSLKYSYLITKSGCLMDNLN